ncbi:hypothetical protein FQA39_LY06549 [Lamprigera yunnana]|nr:hypothetical protein FQA39_LY06549 [Lamprigera yunnana]
MYESTDIGEKERQYESEERMDDRDGTEHLTIGHRDAIQSKQQGRPAKRKETTTKIDMVIGPQAKETLKAETSRIWEERWQQAEKGREVFEYIPNSRMRNEKNCLPNKETVHLISGHGTYNGSVSHESFPYVVQEIKSEIEI